MQIESHHTLCLGQAAAQQYDWHSQYLWCLHSVDHVMHDFLLGVKVPKCPTVYQMSLTAADSVSVKQVIFDGTVSTWCYCVQKLHQPACTLT